MVWSEAHNCLVPAASVNNNMDNFSQQATMPFSFYIKKLHPDAQLPTVAKHGDLGYDLYCLEDIKLTPGNVTKVRTGIACNFPYGYGALIRDRSSVATKQKVFVVAGVIDNGYTGEIIVAMYNPGYIVNNTKSSFGVLDDRLYTSLEGTVQFKKNDKIAQLILTPVIYFPVYEVDELQKTERGSDGFGSTGR